MRSALRSGARALRSSAGLRTIRVGGVPEHFNTPWHLANAAGKYAEVGIALEWVEFPGGTGAMASALRNDQIDVAIGLTEGIVADILKGGPTRIIGARAHPLRGALTPRSRVRCTARPSPPRRSHAPQQIPPHDARRAGEYVSTPLTWGVHVSATSDLRSVEELRARSDGIADYAVSRFGSGSHLMALVDRRERFGDAAESVAFEVVGSLEGARAGLAEGRAHAFMWEKFTTAHLVASGEWRRIDEVPTPWPCFVLAASEAALKRHSDVLPSLLEVTRGEAAALVASPDAVRTIAGMYSLDEAGVEEWLAATRWSVRPTMSVAVLDEVQEALATAGAVGRDLIRSPLSLLADFVALGP